MHPNETQEAHFNGYFEFEFEQNFDFYSALDWLQAYWPTSFIYVTIYVILIHIGQHWMKNKQRFELRQPLIAWNLILALFSMIGSIRFIPEVVFVLRKHGFHFSICSSSYVYQNAAIALWTWLFVLSKIYELGDTVFIILRKQKLIFLHWYHHVTVLLYTWYSSPYAASTGRWFICMNFMVHATMYSYYALRAMKIYVPRSVALGITSFQLLQMVVGLVVNWFAYGALVEGRKCNVTLNNIYVSFIMYVSYFLLFANYFYKTYVKKRNSRKLMVDKEN